MIARRNVARPVRRRRRSFRRPRGSDVAPAADAVAAVEAAAARRTDDVVADAEVAVVVGAVTTSRDVVVPVRVIVIVRRHDERRVARVIAACRRCGIAVPTVVAVASAVVVA